MSGSVKTFYVVILFAIVCNHLSWAQSAKADSCSDFLLNIIKEGGNSDTVRLFYHDCSEKGRDTVLVLNGNTPAINPGLVNRATEAILFTDIHNRFLDGPRVIRFIIEPGQMNLTFSIVNDTVRDLKITGSKSQVEKENWTIANIFLLEKHYYNSRELKDFYGNPDSLYKKGIAAAIVYIKANPDSYFSGYLLRKFIRKIPLDSTQVYYSNLTDRVKQSQLGKDILSDVLALTSDMNFRKKNSDPVFFKQFEKVKSFHDLSLPDVSGKVHHLSKLKGKYVVVDFWGSWCGPCFENISHLEKLVAEMKGRQVEFVSVSIDTDADNWKKAMAKHHFPGLNLVDTAGLAASYYKVPWVPKYIIINPDGTLAHDDAPFPISGELRPLLLSIINKKD